MPTTPAVPRSAEQVNAEIRQLWLDPRVRLSPAVRDRYEALVAEWTLATAAEQGDVVEAA
ncbi:hypothetical protein [Streptomyces sp. SGAir0957]